MNHQPSRVSEISARCFFVLVPVSIVSAFMLFGMIGNAQARNNRRILGLLDPIVDFIRIDGSRFTLWIFDHAVFVGVVVAGASALVWFAGAATTKRLVSPMLPACAGVGLAGLGQVCIVKQNFVLGAGLYGCGVLCAFGLGWVLPISRLPGRSPN